MTVTLIHWAAYMAATSKAEKTVKTRVKVIRHMAELAGVEPTKITRLDVITYLARDLSKSSRACYYQSVERWAEFVREFGDDPTYDPLKGIDRPTPARARARPISDSDIAKLLAAPLHWRTRVYLLLGLLEGLRCCEIAGVRGQDVDRDRSLLLVLGKGGDIEPVPLHPIIAQVARSFPEHGWWFPSPNLDGHVRPGAVSTALGKAMRRAGVEATAHQLRHTAGTRVQTAVGDVRVTQTFLRHRSLGSTQIYTKVADTKMQSAVDALVWLAA